MAPPGAVYSHFTKVVNDCSSRVISVPHLPTCASLAVGFCHIWMDHLRRIDHAVELLFADKFQL